ncbi:MAG TPA: BlaI/MecI/CopY family transcriptional regulator [Pirellulales bacterium]|nr:BlaI/MecI/CopY family transcriptional regulator [Pirellulales bacterium]
MARNQRMRLSAAELEIMAMLWDCGPLSLAGAHQRFAAYGRAIGYTTVQTRLNRLVDKRVVHRSKDRPCVYRATAAPEQIGAGHLDLLLERVSRGNVVPLVAHLVSGRSLSATELKELKALIAAAERRADEASPNQKAVGQRST